jgi:hypothetical protein
VIRAVERVIFVSIKGRAENDEHGPRWYEVKRMKSCNAIDEYELKANGAVFMCEERHQGAGFALTTFHSSYIFFGLGVGRRNGKQTIEEYDRRIYIPGSVQPLL